MRKLSITHKLTQFYILLYLHTMYCEHILIIYTYRLCIKLVKCILHGIYSWPTAIPLPPPSRCEMFIVCQENRSIKSQVKRPTTTRRMYVYILCFSLNAYKSVHANDQPNGLFRTPQNSNSNFTIHIYKNHPFLYGDLTTLFSTYIFI